MRFSSLSIMLVMLVLSALPGLAATSSFQPLPRNGYKIAIIPLKVDGGRGEAKKKLPEIYRTVFEEEGFSVTMGRPVEDAMQQLGMRTEGRIPKQKEMLRIGKRLGVNYVLAADIKVKTKRVWIIVVPQAKSTVTIDTVIVGVRRAEVVFDPKNQVGVSQGGSDVQKGVGLVLSWPAALFMGGSRTKEERKASEKAVQTAYTDFFGSLRTANRKVIR